MLPPPESDPFGASRAASGLLITKGRAAACSVPAALPRPCRPANGKRDGRGTWVGSHWWAILRGGVWCRPCHERRWAGCAVVRPVPALRAACTGPWQHGLRAQAQRVAEAALPWPRLLLASSQPKIQHEALRKWGPCWALGLAPPSRLAAGGQPSQRVHWKLSFPVSPWRSGWAQRVFSRVCCQRPRASLQRHGQRRARAVSLPGTCTAFPGPGP